MSPWQLEYVLNVPRNLPLKFHQNRVSNSWDIADIEFVWVGWGGWCRVILLSNPTLVLRLGWGFDNSWGLLWVFMTFSCHLGNRGAKVFQLWRSVPWFISIRKKRKEVLTRKIGEYLSLNIWTAFNHIILTMSDLSPVSGHHSTTAGPYFLIHLT